MSTPQTTIYLCSGVRLNNRYDHTIKFSSGEAQLTYFHSMVARTLSAYTYARKTWNLKVAATMEEARTWSYLFFQNSTGKIWYYFINQAEYVNDSTVELALELDVMQSYQFDWEMLACYVEREHIVTDTFGANTIDEGLDVGDPIINKTSFVDLGDDLVIMIASTIDINKLYFNQQTVKNLGSYYDKIFGGFQLFAVDAATAWDDLAIMLNYLDTQGQAEAIYIMWQYPASLINSDNGSYENVFAKYVTTAKAYIEGLPLKPTTIDGYTPKNKKVFQYPYNFLYATNNNGAAAVYKYEFFDSEEINFYIEGNIAPDAVVKVIPLNYKGATGSGNNDESIAVAPFPVCAWNSDVYKLWLAQNQNQQNLGFAMSGLKILGGAAAIVGSVAAGGATAGASAPLSAGGVAAGVGLIASGASGIGSQLAQRGDKEIMPPQSRGAYSGNHTISRGMHGIDFYYKSVDAYHAKMIDDYFTMYGYATRTCKIRI